MTFFRKKRKPRIERDVPGKKAEPRPGDSKKHLEYIRSLPCVCCGAPRGDPHHLIDIKPYGKQKALGGKHEDMWCIPLCRKHHDGIHNAGAKNQNRYLIENGSQMFALNWAMELAKKSPDPSVKEAMQKMIFQYEYRKRLKEREQRT